MSNENLGKTLRYFRRLHDIELKQMAADLNVSVSRYGMMERGESGLTMATFWKAMEILKLEMQAIPLRPSSEHYYHEVDKVLRQKNARTSRLFKKCKEIGIAITLQPMRSSIKYEHIITMGE